MLQRRLPTHRQRAELLSPANWEAQLRCQQIPWRYLFKTEARKAELEVESRHPLHPPVADARQVADPRHYRHRPDAQRALQGSERVVFRPTPLQRACCYHPGGRFQPLAGARVRALPLVLSQTTLHLGRAPVWRQHECLTAPSMRGFLSQRNWSSWASDRRDDVRGIRERLCARLTAWGQNRRRPCRETSGTCWTPWPLHFRRQGFPAGRADPAWRTSPWPAPARPTSFATRSRESWLGATSATCSMNTTRIASSATGRGDLAPLARR